MDELKGDYSSPIFQSSQIYKEILSRNSKDNGLDALVDDYEMYVKNANEIFYGKGLSKLFNRIYHSFHGDFTREQVLDSLKSYEEEQSKQASKMSEELLKEYNRVKEERTRLEKVLGDADKKRQMFLNDRKILLGKYGQFLDKKKNKELSDSEIMIQESQLLNDLYLNKMKFAQSDRDYKNVKATYQVAVLSENLYTSMISSLNSINSAVKTVLAQLKLVSSKVDVKSFVDLVRRSTRTSDILNDSMISKVNSTYNMIQDVRNVTNYLNNKTANVDAVSEKYDRLNESQHEEFLKSLMQETSESVDDTDEIIKKIKSNSESISDEE